MTSVVLAVGTGGSAGGSRALVRSADSAARQTSRAGIVLALTRSGPGNPVVESLGDRLGATAVRGDTEAGALNAAVRAADSEFVIVLTTPWRLVADAVERCGAALAATPRPDVVIPTLRIESQEGHPLRIVAIEPTLAYLLANPLATPPVYALRREAWEKLGGMDGELGAFGPFEWWLRLAGAGYRASLVEAPLAALAATERDWWPPPAAEPFDVDRYRAVLAKHEAFLHRHMSELVIDREMAFGRLMGEHRDAIARRDASLAELEALRAGVAHHRAYLEHHRLDAFEWGDLRRPDPVSRDWGYDRGVPLDRRYIEDFLAAHSSDVRGTVLEVQEDDFSRRFGGPRVARSEVVDLDDANPRATIAADLRSAKGIASSQFDAIVLTQTLHVIPDMPAVLAECARLLAPGGVLLATLPSASRVCLEYGEDGDLWRFTPAGARALFEPSFGIGNVEVTAYGNVLTNVAFLHGLACGDVADAEFDAPDPYHPVLVGVRARKQPDAAPARRAARARPGRGVILLYHRVDEIEDVHDLAVPAALLEEQFARVARDWRVVPLEQLLNDARDGLPGDAVALTFDDGYLDTLERAAPLLERLGLPATVFATTRWLDERGEYWWDTLERALLENETPPVLNIDIGGRPLTFATSTPGERRAAHDALHGLLAHAALGERDAVTSRILRWSGTANGPRRRPLTSDELKTLAQVPGIDIGAHTTNHLSLPDQPADVQRSEIVDSVKALERVLARPVTTFAFPYGAVDRATADLARVSCRWSVSCVTGAVGASFDAARVPRLEVKRWDGDALGSRLERLFKGEPA